MANNSKSHQHKMSAKEHLATKQTAHAKPKPKPGIAQLPNGSFGKVVCIDSITRDEYDLGRYLCMAKINGEFVYGKVLIPNDDLPIFPDSLIAGDWAGARFVPTPELAPDIVTVGVVVMPDGSTSSIQFIHMDQRVKYKIPAMCCAVLNANGGYTVGKLMSPNGNQFHPQSQSKDDWKGATFVPTPAHQPT